MNREHSRLLDYKRTEITEDRPIYTPGDFWADPSVAQAAAYMSEICEHPKISCDRAIKKLLALDAAGLRMRQRLEHIAAS